MLLLISWRNVWRNKIRSLILICAVAVGLWAGVVTISISNGVIDQMIETAIETNLSHIQIQHPEFKENNNINFYIKDG